MGHINLKKEVKKIMAINRKLGRTTAQRKSILKSLTTDLILHEKIETTEAKQQKLEQKKLKQ